VSATAATPDAAGTGKVCRLPLPALRAPNTAIRRQALDFRRAFEAVVLREKGEVNELDAKTLRTASKAYAAALRCDRILARAGEIGVVTIGETAKTQDGASAVKRSQTGLTHEQHLAYLDRSVKFEDACDRALSRLGIDKSVKADVWSEVNAGRFISPPVGAANGQGHEPPAESETSP
jgi:hypothetical protein